MLAKLLRALRWVLAGLGLLMLVVTLTPLDYWWATGLAGNWNDASGDVLIVLGGSMLEPNVLGLSSYWRSVYAVLAWRGGHFRTVVVSGKGPAGPMRDFLVCQGVPAESILVENAAGSTRENALFTKRLLENVPGRKVLLTSDYHMYRARRAFEKAGLAVTPVPFPDVRKRETTLPGRWPAFLDLMRETAKIAYYRLRGWI